MYIKDFILLKKIIQILIKKGKKTYALKVFLRTLENLKYANIDNFSSWDIIYKSLANIKPMLYVWKMKKRRKVFILPKLINAEQKLNLSLHWILKSVLIRKEKKLEERLTNEFLDCFKGKGGAVIKKQKLYETINKSRPYLHLLIYK